MHDGPDNGSLSATAAVALRWRIADAGDQTLVQAECAASLRALVACLEAAGTRPEGYQPPDRVEAKLDLLLIGLDRLSQAVSPAVPGGRGTYLECDAYFGPESIEWEEPLPPPTDGTRVILEVRAAPGHPVIACLPATVTRLQAAAADTLGGNTRLRAMLDPMPADTRDAYERCVFVLHRRALRRRIGNPSAV